MAKLVSKYQLIWDKIRADGSCIVEADPRFFEKLIKRVIKIKTKDISFKVINDHDYFFLDITRDVEKKRVVFLLKQRYGIEERKQVV